MTGVVTRALTMVVFLLVGMALWQTGRLERQAASALRHVSELGFKEAVKEYDELEQSVGAIAYVPGFGANLLGDVRAQRAVARYWLADYRAIEPADEDAESQNADPVLLFAAANVVYRSAASTQRDADRAMKAYANVLKVSPGHADAAYNYEFLARRRAAPAPRGAQPETDAPPPATVHGVQGAPPKGADMGQFRIVIPKRGEERKEDPEAGSGKQRIRRG